jgi:hypothetical protein
MYNLKTPKIQKLVTKLVTECEEYFNKNISDAEPKFKKFQQDFDNVVEVTEPFKTNEKTEINITETTLKKLRSEGWDNPDDPVLISYEKENSGIFNRKGGRTKLYDSGISYKGRTFDSQTSKKNAELGLYERLEKAKIDSTRVIDINSKETNKDNGIVFYRDAGKGYEQEFSKENNTFVPVPVEYTEAKWIMLKDNDDNSENNKIVIDEEKYWPNDYFPEKPDIKTYGDFYRWIFSRDYGAIYYDERPEPSNINLQTGTNGSTSTSSSSTQTNIPNFGSFLPNTNGTSGNNLFNPDYYAKGSTTPKNTPLNENPEKKFDLVTGLAYQCLRITPLDIQNSVYSISNIKEKIKKNIDQNHMLEELTKNREYLMTYKKFSFGKDKITPDVFAKKVVDLYLEKFDNSLILNKWDVKNVNDFWSNGLKNKVDGKSDIGIKHIVSREYPYEQSIYGDDSFFEIENPWENSNTLYDLLIAVIKEKNPELIPKDNTPLTPKFKPTIKVGDLKVEELSGETKTDLPDFSIYVGDPERWPEPEKNKIDEGFIDDFNDVLDEEYLEEESNAEAELEIKVENIDVTETLSLPDTPNAEGAFNPAVDIEPVSSLDALLDRAGKCVVAMGQPPEKVARCNAKNMKKGYIGGIHGLCPLGTQAVCYAMIGDWKKSCGNGNSYSYKTGVEYEGAKLDQRYYLDKVRPPGWTSGMTKPPSYFTDNSQWQIGDVIAIAYKKEPNGHIQVWTGINWMSDFKQNKIQSPPKNDYETVALWRLNEKGIEAVKKNMPTIA